jgi:hypothetical protein
MYFLTCYTLPPGWLENLISRIAEDRTRVVCPVIDIINDDTFAYVRSFELHWGAFNWELHFRWYTLGGGEIKRRKQDITQPFRYSPGFSINFTGFGCRVGQFSGKFQTSWYRIREYFFLYQEKPSTADSETRKNALNVRSFNIELSYAFQDSSDGRRPLCNG